MAKKRTARTRLGPIERGFRELTSQELDRVNGGISLCSTKQGNCPPQSTETWPQDPDGLMDID